MTLADDVIAAVEWLDDPGPRRVRGIRTSHAVPYGRVFRQWDTNGDLWAWVNRGEIEDLPRGPQPHPAVGVFTVIDFGSIPVYNE